MSFGIMSREKVLRICGALGLLSLAWYGGFLTGTWRSGSSQTVSVGSSSLSTSIARERIVAETETHSESVPFHSEHTTSRQASEVLVAIRDTFRQTSEVERTRRLIQLVEGLEPAAIKSLLEQLDGYPRSDREELCKLLISRWAQFSPAEALNFAVLLKDAGIAGTAMRAGLSVWVSTNPHAAREWLRGPVPLQFKRYGLELVVDLLARDQPEMALRLYEENPLLHQDASRVTKIIDRWAMNDPEAASRAALRMAPGAGRDNALTTVALRWAETDAQAALAWTQQLADPEMRKVALSEVLKGWAETDPDGAISHALTLPVGDGRTKAITAVGPELAKQDPARAITLAQQIPEGTARDEFLKDVIQAAASRNPQGASQMIESIPEGDARAGAVETVMSQWLNLNRPEALEWLTQLPYGESRARALRRTMIEWGKAEPKAAFDWMVKNAPPTDDDRSTYFALYDSIGTWIEDNRGEAVDWLAKLPSGDTKDRLIAAAAENLAGSDPKGTVAFIEKNGSPDIYKRCANSIAIAWSKQDPAAAAAWAWTLPQGDIRTGALRFVGTEWCKRDPAKAATWLNTLPSGTERDTTVTYFAQTAINTDPESALAWVATVGETEKRDETFEKLLKTWLVRDQTAARRWMNSSQDISPELRNRLMSYK